MNKIFRVRVNQQFALAGLLGASVLTFQFPASARALDSQSTLSGNSINLDDGDIITANINFTGGTSNEFTGIAGVYNQKGMPASINLGSNSQINAISNTNSAGIYIGSNDSSLGANALKINVKVAQNGNAYGVKVSGNNANINLGTGSEIITESPKTGLYETVGILLESNASIFANKIMVQSTGYYRGASVRITGSGTVDLGSESTIIGNIESQAQGGLFKAQSINITGTISASGGGKIEIGANSHLKSNTALYLSQGVNDLGGTIDFKGTAGARNSVEGLIFTAGTKSQLNLDYTDISGSLEASIGSSINLTNSTLTRNNNNYGFAINANNGSTVNFSGENKLHRANAADILIYNNAATVTAQAKMDMFGSIFADGNSLIDMNMTQGSIWTGSAGKLYTEQAGVINLNFSGSLWNMSADSQISKLALNNSTVDFIENRLGSKLSVADLSGNGTFIMDVDLISSTGTNSGDLLRVTNSSQGDHKIKIRNQGALSTTGNETLTIVETSDGGATFSLLNNRRAELGGYVYDVRRSSNQTDWELYSKRQTKEQGSLSSSAKAAGNFLNTNYLLNYAEIQTLLQRMGELRQGDNPNGDAWVRAYTGKFDSFGDTLSGFDMDYNGVQTGIDKQININDDKIYLGVMTGITKADSKFTDGNGNVKGYHFGIYGTYVTDNDFYLDSILKYGSLKNTFDVVDTENKHVDGSARSHAYSLNLEAGKRFYLQEAKTGFYLEPQIQLSYTHQESAQTRASNGLIVDLNSYDSTIGRISTLIGYEIKNSANPMNIYFKTGYVTEMSGDVDYALNGSKENHDFGGDWWNNGLGITAQINKKHNLYVEGAYSTGSKFDQIQLNAGYRYSF